MAISGKPAKPSPAPPPPQPNEQDVLSLIHKGGSVAKSAASPAKASGLKLMLLQLRLPPELVEEIDAVRKTAKAKRYREPSRHAWILSAIEEKIAREQSAS